MATAMPTANNPLNACWTLSRRTNRRTKTTRAQASAAQMPVPRPSRALATMNATVGRVASTMPRQPPSCSSTRCRSKVSGRGSPPPSGAAALPVAVTAVSPGSLSAGVSGPILSTSGAGPRSAGAQLVPGVVDDPLAVDGGEPPAGGEGAAGLDARDAPAAQPHEGDRAGAVEQLGLEGRDGLARGVDHGLETTGHLHDRALAARDHRLAAGAGGLGAQFLGVDRRVVGGQSLQRPRQPAGGTGLSHVLSSLRSSTTCRQCSAPCVTSQAP